MLVKNTNLTLQVVAKTKGNTTYSVTGIAIPQKFKTKHKANNFGNTTVTDGFITINSNSTSALTRTDTGTVNEVSTNLIKAIVPLNKSLKIALISLSPATGYVLLRKPNAILRKAVKGLRVFLEETATANVYNLMCNMSREIKQSENVIIDLDYLIGKQAVASPSNTIKKVIVGKTNIPTYGCSKNIKIYGSPNTPFELSVLDNNNKNLLTQANSTGPVPSGVVDVFSGTLNKRGYYSYYQKFPSAPIVLSTAVNVGGGVSNVRQVTFDSLSGVLVGDEIIAVDSRNQRIDNGETIKVVSIDSTYVCTLSRAVTLADDTKVKFRRNASYKINVETTGTKGSKVNATYPTHTLTQNLDNVVTFNATTSVGAIRINGGSGGVTHSVSYSQSSYGQNQQGLLQRDILLIYTLTGKTFTVTSGHPSIADFVKASGDANISGIVTGSGSSTTTYTVTARLNLTYGSEDTVFNINVDNIVT
jgi:hypothetical protein